MHTNASLDPSNWLVFVNAVCFYVSSTPPNQPLPESKQIMKSTYEQNMLLRLLVHKIFVCSVCALHILSTFAGEELGLCAAQPPASHKSSGPAAHSTILITTTCAGLVMTAIRLWCFATLGKHFDFQVNIKKTHQLITSGPYSFVRHPAYTSAFGSWVAITMVMFSEDHWFSRCAQKSTVGWVAGWVWLVEVAMLGYTALAVRPKVEDEELKKHFGNEWDEWAAKVPYRIFPYVY
ncbi:hypothetical protein CCMSSC00406_0008149 [Pleurotus cornucopiae]|uniref:Uncharacterized protein n=1 Tax=Pleurotus cornucopiae TaxID=5321 RepID=A0ACB7ING8_PLECO|nr:hypothetical protein CCMSSC00406_0008149 [Pleurotus cornucopiae]